MSDKENKGCDFCNNFDFSRVTYHVDYTFEKKSADIYLAGSAKYPRGQQFDYCPACGKKREG